MTIHKAKANDYSTVTAHNVAEYIKDYANDIENMVYENTELEKKNKAQLNAIAAELETVKKRLDCILYGIY